MSWQFSVPDAPVVDTGVEAADTHAFLGVEQRHPFFKLQQQALEMIARGKPVAATLTRLALFLESVITDSYCAIFLVEDDGRRLCEGAAPSLPPGLAEAFNGLEIGPAQPACATAAHYRQPVICADVAIDPLWQNYRQWVMDSFGIHAAWSYPFFCSKNNVVGTFAVFRRYRGTPGPKDIQIIERCKHLASIAIEKHCDQYALQQALIRAEAGNAAKSVFLANVSHELLTPLNAIIGYSDLLAEETGEQVGDKFRADVQHIREASRSLLQIVNNVLQLTQLNTNKVKLHLQAFDVGAAVGEVIDRYRPVLEDKGIRLLHRLPVVPLGVYSDRGMFQEILSHLLDNAVKFSDQGCIEICVTAERVEHGQNVLMKVSDTGIGIAADKIASIFDVFTQADQSFTRQYGGAGLGLAVCASLGRLLHGSFDIDSAPGKGSTFIFTMPARRDA